MGCNTYEHFHSHGSTITARERSLENEGKGFALIHRGVLVTGFELDQRRLIVSEEKEVDILEACKIAALALIAENGG